MVSGPERMFKLSPVEYPVQGNSTAKVVIVAVMANAAVIAAMRANFFNGFICKFLHDYLLYSEVKVVTYLLQKLLYTTCASLSTDF